MIGVSASDRRRAEIVRNRDPATGRATWSIDEILRDPRDGTEQRVFVIENASLRDILADALALEKTGVRVSRKGVAR